MTVVLATATRRAEIAVMLARAFADDPAMSWIFPDATLRARRLPGLFQLLFDEDGPNGVRLMDDAARAATLWRGPGAAHTGTLAMLRQIVPLVAVFGGALPRALAVSRAIEAHMPMGAFWYLHIAGCDPAHQGKGLGRALVKAGLERMGASGLPFYLETATERNLGFYQSLGFEVTDDWTVPGGGPRFWSMLAGR
ncbi:MAG: GNAT family N-acetyltransferase [Sphingomonas sp.]